MNSKRKLIILGVIFFSFFILSFRSPFIRISNTTDMDFDQVTVGFPSRTINYGPLKAHAVSDYAWTWEAYSYAAVEVKAGNLQGSLQPEDYFGQKPLPIGFYTYEIFMEASTNDTTGNIPINTSLK